MRVAKSEAELLLHTILSDRPVVAATIALAIFVGAIVVLYVATASQPATSLGATIHWEVGLGEDRSMGEIAGYGISFLAAVLFFLVFAESRSPMFLSLAVLMAFVWFDDAASYHERLGSFLSDARDLPVLPRTRQQDTGELMAWALAGTVLGAFFLYSLLRRRPGDLGAFVLVSLGFLSLLFFAVLTDMLHIAAPQNLHFVIGVIEDGGEMFALVFIAGVALGCARNYPAYRQLLGDSVHTPSVAGPHHASAKSVSQRN